MVRFVLLCFEGRAETMTYLEGPMVVVVVVARGGGGGN